MRPALIMFLLQLTIEHLTKLQIFSSHRMAIPSRRLDTRRGHSPLAPHGWRCGLFRFAAELGNPCILWTGGCSAPTRMRVGPAACPQTPSGFDERADGWEI